MPLNHLSDKHLQPIFGRTLQMARRLLLRPGVGRSEGQQRTRTPMRCVMAALLAVLAIVAYATIIPPPGKAGW